MKQRILILMCVLLLGMTCSAWAYRLIVIPCGDLLPQGFTRLEYASAKVSGQGEADGWYTGYQLDAVILPNMEVGVNVADPHGAGGTFTTVSVQYRLLAPTAQRPGLSIGSWDLGSRTMGANRGRSTFGCVYQSVPVKSLVGPVSVNLGYGDQTLHGFFGGVVVPVDKRTQFVAEYNPKNARLPGGKWYNIALGSDLTPNWRVKVADMGGHIAFGIVYTDHL